MQRRNVVWVAAALLPLCSLLPVGAEGSKHGPRIDITYPKAGNQTIAQNAVVRGRASDDGQVTEIRISIDAGRSQLGICPCPQPSLRWHFVLPELAFGTHEIQVTALDDLGQPSSATRHFTIPEPQAAYRAFTDDSWWNTPLPADAPVDTSSHRWIHALVRETDHTPLKLTGLPNSFPDQAQPVYFTDARDPRFTIRLAHGPTVTIHIPRHAIPSGADNPKMTVIDTAKDQGVGLVGAVFSGGRWTASGVDRYYLSSEGISEGAGGTVGNAGHRGATMVLKALRLEEVLLGPIGHRAECFVPPSLVGSEPVWPMTGSDGELVDGIPEGIVLRIDPSVDLASRRLSPDALVLAMMLQDYGCAVTDGGAPHAVTLRLDRADWSSTTLRRSSLGAIPWRDWVFVEGGYRP